MKNYPNIAIVASFFGLDGFLPTYNLSNNIWIFLNFLPLESCTGPMILLLIKYKSKKITVHGL
jgi:hypothetical protein